MVIFHSYVSLPEGNLLVILILGDPPKSSRIDEVGPSNYLPKLRSNLRGLVTFAGHSSLFKDELMTSLTSLGEDVRRTLNIISCLGEGLWKVGTFGKVFR